MKYFIAPFHSFLLNLLDFIFPPICSVCKQGLLRNEKVICEKCYSSITWISDDFCIRCGRPLFRKDICNHCQGMEYLNSKCRAAGIYEGVLVQAVHLLKYKRRLSLAKRLGEMMATIPGTAFFAGEGTIILPVPLHPSRLRERGYNQSELLARTVAEHHSLPISTNNLVRIRATPSQTELPEDKRILNVQGAFKVKRPQLLSGKRVILIDDVMTTGATLNSCAATLLEVGVREVYALTAAITP